MIVPRAGALIRHRAERYDPDSIFDVGLAIVRRDTTDREIEKLRERLTRRGLTATSIAALAALHGPHSPGVFGLDTLIAT